MKHPFILLEMLQLPDFSKPVYKLDMGLPRCADVAGIVCRACWT